MVVRGKWAIGLLTVLCLSLAVNIFLLGAAASLRHFGPPGFERHVASRDIPREARRYIRRELRQRRGEFREARAALENTRAAVGTATRADPFDRVQLMAAIEAHTVNQNRMRSIVIEAVTEAIDQMPADLRKQVKIEHFRPGRFGRHGPPKGPPPGPPLE